jgi:hypothetical protein
MTRRHLTDTERHDMLERQGGLCFAPKCMSEGPFIAEHWTPVALGNDAKPDCLLCIDCAKRKTFGLRGDISNIAKAKRIAEGRTQFDKRAAAGGSRIRGRGFDKSLSKKMNGEVIRNG